MLDSLQTLLVNYSVMTTIAIAILVCTSMSYIQYIICKYFSTRLVKNELFALNALLKSVYWPLLVFIWFCTIIFVLDTLPIQKSATYTIIQKYLQQFSSINHIFLLAWAFIRFIENVETLLSQGTIKTRLNDPTTIQIVGKVSRIIATVIVGFIAFPILGVPVSGLLAFGGGSAIVLGIAAQQIFSNYLGGFLIHLDRNFKVGDWVYSPDRDIEGHIENINWRTTTIRTLDKRALFVPNAIFSSIVTINGSKMTNWRINETIPIRYTDIDVIDLILQDIHQMLIAHEDLDQTQNTKASLTKLSQYSLDITVSSFTKTTDKQKYREILQDILIKICKILKNHHAEIANPWHLLQTDIQSSEKPKKNNTKDRI